MLSIIWTIDNAFPTLPVLGSRLLWFFIQRNVYTIHSNSDSWRFNFIESEIFMNNFFLEKWSRDIKNYLSEKFSVFFCVLIFFNGIFCKFCSSVFFYFHPYRLRLIGIREFVSQHRVANTFWTTSVNWFYCIKSQMVEKSGWHCYWQEIGLNNMTLANVWRQSWLLSNVCVKCKPHIRNVRTWTWTYTHSCAIWTIKLSIWLQHFICFHPKMTPSPFVPFHFHCLASSKLTEEQTVCACVFVYVLFSVRLCNTFIFRALESQ